MDVTRLVLTGVIALGVTIATLVMAVKEQVSSRTHFLLVSTAITSVYASGRFIEAVGVLYQWRRETRDDLIFVARVLLVTVALFISMRMGVINEVVDALGP